MKKLQIVKRFPQGTTWQDAVKEQEEHYQNGTMCGCDAWGWAIALPWQPTEAETKVE